MTLRDLEPPPTEPLNLCDQRANRILPDTAQYVNQLEVDIMQRERERWRKEAERKKRFQRGPRVPSSAG